MLAAGEMAGDLLLIRRMPGSQWICRCRCGQVTVRSGSSLSWSLSRGCVPKCESCRAQSRAWIRRLHFAFRGRHILWQRGNTLYTIHDLAALQERIRDDLAQDFGYPTETLQEILHGAGAAY